MRNGCAAKASGKNRNQRKLLRPSNKRDKDNSPNVKVGNSEAVPSRSRDLKVGVQIDRLVAAPISQSLLTPVARTVRVREIKLVPAVARTPQQTGLRGQVGGRKFPAPRVRLKNEAITRATANN